MTVRALEKLQKAFPGSEVVNPTLDRALSEIWKPGFTPAFVSALLGQHQKKRRGFGISTSFWCPECGEEALRPARLGAGKCPWSEVYGCTGSTIKLDENSGSIGRPCDRRGCDQPGIGLTYWGEVVCHRDARAIWKHLRKNGWPER